MFTSTLWALCLFGISGILGSLKFIFRDLSYIPGSTTRPAIKMSAMSDSRLINAGTLGLPGCWFTIYLPVAISSLMMLHGILARKSLYPVWMEKWEAR